MNLYELTGQVLECQEMIGQGVDEQVIHDTLESLDFEIEMKADNYAKLMRNLQAEADAYGAEIKRMTDRKKALESHVEWLKRNLEQSMIAIGKEKFKTKLFSFGIQNNPPKVVIDDPQKVPQELLIQQEPKVDLAVLKNLLSNQEGERNEYAHLERGRSLRIR